MLAQLKVAGLAGTVIDAIDGRRLSERDLANSYDESAALRNCHRVLTRGEVGCALSHLAIYRRMVAEGLSWAVVLEDDALLGRDFRPIVEAIGERLDASVAEICLLSHVDKYMEWGRRQLPRERHLVRMVRAHGAHAYVVTSAAAEALLSANSPVVVPADYWMYFVGNKTAKISAVVPYCVGFSPFETQSIIQAERGVQVARLEAKFSSRLWWWIQKYVFWRTLYQLGIKQALRIKKQKLVW